MIQKEPEKKKIDSFETVQGMICGEDGCVQNAWEGMREGNG
jgi:hypothetical protein